MFRQLVHRCGDRAGRGHPRGGGPFGGSLGGGFRGGGRGMRTARMLASGDLQLIILLLLSEKPRHGYEIMPAIEEGRDFRFSPSSIYPAPQMLDDATASAFTP